MMREIWDFILYLFASAVAQNIVLTTGLGSSMLMRVVRHPKDILPFSAMLGGFSVLTVAICYPLDDLIGTGVWAKLLRPLMIAAVVAVLYCIAHAILKRACPAFYIRMAKFLPLAAFNNLVIGVALICNHNFTTTFFGAIGLTLGGCAGFILLSLVTAEGIERVDNPDIPPAFRGLPIILVFVGLLALAVLGFAPAVPLI